MKNKYTIIVLLIIVGTLIYFSGHQWGQYKALKEEFHQINLAYDINRVSRIDLENSLKLLEDDWKELERELGKTVESYDNYKDDVKLLYEDKKILSEEDHFSMVMGYFAAQVKLSYLNKFDRPPITINSTYEIKDDWYILKGPYLDITVEGYEDAERVNFYYSKQETCLVDALLFSDHTPEDGWRYHEEDVKDIFSDSDLSTYKWPSTYSIYAEIIYSNGLIKYSALLPIYRIDEH